MKAWLLTALVALTFAGATASAAKATEVSIRVEGASATLLETRVETTPHLINGGDGTGSHPCRGPLGEEPGATVTGALDDATRVAGLSWRGLWSSSSGDFLVTEIAGEAATSSGPWTILLNGAPTPVGGCSMKVADGDRVLFARDVVFQTMTLGLSGPDEVLPGESFTLRVEDERTGFPVQQAEIRAGDLSHSTGVGGQVDLRIDEPGRYRFKATHPDGIRSNTWEVCVGVSGCSGDSGPAVRVTDLPDQARFLRGATPINLRGTARSPELRLAIKQRGKGRCKAWAGPRKRLVKRRCKAKPRWVPGSTEEGRWTYRLGTLPPGRYRIWLRLAGVSSPWRTGVNRVDFTVLPKRLNRRLLLRRGLGYLDRNAGRSLVGSSGLLAGWSGLALGVRDRRSGRGLLRSLRAAQPGRLTDGDLSRNLAALVRIRQGATNAAMRQALLSRQSADGSFSSDINLTAMSILALPGTQAAADGAAWLANQQRTSGGFSAGSGGMPDVDTTGLAAWALAESGFTDAVQAAASFVRGTQNGDGGFPAVVGSPSNAQSTGLGMVAIRVAGSGRLGPKNSNGITPTHYLATLQRRSGSIDYVAGLSTLPVWVTSQALLGLSARGQLVK